MPPSFTTTMYNARVIKKKEIKLEDKNGLKIRYRKMHGK